MAKVYLVVGLLSLSVFAWAQYHGIGLFDNVADSSLARSSGQRNTFHK